MRVTVTFLFPTQLRSSCISLSFYVYMYIGWDRTVHFIYIASFPSMQPFLAIQCIFRLNAATTISVEKHILFVASGSYWLVLQQDLWLYSTLTSTDGITSFSRGTNASSV